MGHAIIFVWSSKILEMGLPWWPSGYESACHVGDMGSIPDLGRSHMPQSNQARVPQLLRLCSRAQETQLLSPCAATAKLECLRACAPQQEKPLQWEVLARQLESREKPTRSSEDPALLLQRKNLSFNAGDTGLIPGQGTKIPQASSHNWRAHTP